MAIHPEDTRQQEEQDEHSKAPPPESRPSPALKVSNNLLDNSGTYPSLLIAKSGDEAVVAKDIDDPRNTLRSPDNLFHRFCRENWGLFRGNLAQSMPDVFHALFFGKW